MTEMNEWYWTYRAPKPEPQAPTELDMSDADWNSLSPGMRREITRQFEKKHRINPVYAQRVMECLDEFERQDRRQLKDRKADIERAGRQRL